VAVVRINSSRNGLLRFNWLFFSARAMAARAASTGSENFY
jgi:hypothetical protein